MANITISEEQILTQLKREWAMIECASRTNPNLVENMVTRFLACTSFVEAITGLKYTATEDGVVKC